MKTCDTCAIEKRDDEYYAGHLNCIVCVTAKRQQARAKANAPNAWYREASGNKKPMGHGFEVCFGTRWLSVGPMYVRMLTTWEQRLVKQRNPKAARAVRYHRLGLPTTLPYIVTFTGTEWPLVARMLCVFKNVEDKRVARPAYNIYQRFSKAKREAQLEYDERSHHGDGASGTGDAPIAHE